MPILRIRTLRVGPHQRVVLCDSEGRVLPSQRATRLVHEVDSPGVLTVEFMIDGRDVVSELEKDAEPAR